jgi:hypothetical protein
MASIYPVEKRPGEAWSKSDVRTIRGKNPPAHSLHTALMQTKASVRAHCGQFVKGEPVDDCRFMKRVEDRRMTPVDFTHEVWSISPRFGEPQYRFFGAFVTRDWFLVTSKQDRDRLEEHDNRWHEEIDKVLRIWKALFGDDLRHNGNQLSDYISMNAVHCDDRW